jgi:thiol-disulfide isomerase/thioredoxin
MDLDRPRARPPEFPEATWINALSQPTLAGLRGRAAVIYVWNTTDPACLHPLPSLRAWHERYGDIAEFLGIHVPAFPFARERSMVQAAARRLGIRWPMMLDSEALFARELGADPLPFLLLLDAQGFVRRTWDRRSPIVEVELQLQAILREGNPSLSLPEPLRPIAPEGSPGAIRAPVTPDLGPGDLGNPFPPSPVPTILEAPAVHEDGRFYLEGLWQGSGGGFTLAGSLGRIRLRYRGSSVSAVLSPAPDPLAISLNLIDAAEVQLTQDDQSLPKDHFAEDTYLAGENARVRVDFPRLYSLVRNPDARPRELVLEARAPGLTLYAFYFGATAVSGAGTRLPLTE